MHQHGTGRARIQSQLPGQARGPGRGKVESASGAAGRIRKRSKENSRPRRIPGSPEGSGSPGNLPPEAVHQSLPEAAGQNRTGTNRTERGQRVPPPGRESGASAHAAVPQWRMVESAFPILHARGKQLLRPRTGDRGQAPVSVFSSPQMPLLPPCLNPLIYFYKRAYLQESAPSGPGFPCRLPEGRAFAPARTPRETRAPDKSALCMRHGGCAGPGKQSGEQDADWNPFPCAAFLPRCLARQANKGEQGQTNRGKGDGGTGETGSGEHGEPRLPAQLHASARHWPFPTREHADPGPS